jgi:hypothetical protein
MQKKSAQLATEIFIGRVIAERAVANENVIKGYFRT